MTAWRLVLALSLLAGSARADGELRCEASGGTTCEGSVCRDTRVTHVSSYPADVGIGFVVRSANAPVPFVKASAPVLERHASMDFSSWLPPAGSTERPLPWDALSPGQWTQEWGNLPIESYDECVRMGAIVEGDRALLDVRLTVWWDAGQAQCTARVVCHGP